MFHIISNIKVLMHYFFQRKFEILHLTQKTSKVKKITQVFFSKNKHLINNALCFDSFLLSIYHNDIVPSSSLISNPNTRTHRGIHHMCYRLKHVLMLVKANDSPSSFISSTERVNKQTKTSSVGVEKQEKKKISFPFKGFNFERMIIIIVMMMTKMPTTENKFCLSAWYQHLFNSA